MSEKEAELESENKSDKDDSEQSDEK